MVRVRSHFVWLQMRYTFTRAVATTLSGKEKRGGHSMRSAEKSRQLLTEIWQQRSPQESH